MSKIYVSEGNNYRRGRGGKDGVHTEVGLVVRVGVTRGATVDVGKGVTLGVNDGSRQAGIESTRAAGSRVFPN